MAITSTTTITKLWYIGAFASHPLTAVAFSATDGRSSFQLWCVFSQNVSISYLFFGLTPLTLGSLKNL